MMDQYNASKIKAGAYITNLNSLLYSERATATGDVMFLGCTSFEYCSIAHVKIGLIALQKRYIHRDFA